MPNATRLEWIGKYAAVLSALVAMAFGIGPSHGDTAIHH